MFWNRTCQAGARPTTIGRRRLGIRRHKGQSVAAPQARRRLVEAWAGFYKLNWCSWARLRAGKPPFKIEPLR
jgi:hypothetical protein